MADPGTGLNLSQPLIQPGSPISGSMTASANNRITTGGQTVADTTAGTGQARSFFSPDQQAAQGQYFNNIGGFLSGSQQVPAYMTAPPQVFEAYNNAFNKYVQPGIAAQFGQGSNQIGAQKSFGNQQLAAQLYQGGVQQWLSGLGMLGNAGFNPQGQNTASNQIGNQQQQMNQNQTDMGLTQTVLGQSLLSLLLGKLGVGTP